MSNWPFEPVRRRFCEMIADQRCVPATVTVVANISSWLARLDPNVLSQSSLAEIADLWYKEEGWRQARS
jgi:hypothetical protein